MSVENENIEPVTELGLSLSYSSQRIQRRLNSATGAGANAGTRLDIEFAATDPLSELVWSPQNGLSLKCADYGFEDKRPPLLWGAEPSNVVLSPSKDITAGSSRTDKPIIEENFIMSRSAFHGMSEMAGKDNSTRTPEIDVAVMPICGSSHEDRTGTRCVEEMNNVAGTSVQHINEISEAKENIFSSFPDELGPDFAQYEISSRNPAGGGIEVGGGKETSRMETVLASEAHRTKECESNKSSMQNLTSPGRRHEKSALFLEIESKNKKTIINSLLDRLESTSENDLRTFIGKNARGATTEILASESSHEDKNSSRQDEQMLPKDKMTSGNHSPNSSRILRYRRKGKEKALSDGDFNGRMSKEDDESHESVESCNSTRLFSTGKKRSSFEQQLIVGSKKVKTQINESPGSTSFNKHDSSFMNWISNMMKGFAKSNEDEAPPSLALTLAHPNHGHESHDQNIITYPKNQDYGCKNVGFQSIFRSLYCPKMKAVQDKTMGGGYQQELELGNQLCDIGATPIACHGDNDNLCKQFLLSNERYNVSNSGNEASKSTQPKISSAKFSSSQENSKANSAENKNSCNLAMDSSMDKHKTSSIGKIDSASPSEVKISHDFGHGSNPLRSLWIARFIPKTSIPLINLECQNRSSIGQVLESSTNFQRLFPSSQNPVGSSNDLKNVDVEPQSTEDPPVVAGKELQICAAETEASVGFNRIKGQNYRKLNCKLNPIVPSSRLKNSEAMASLFARRLDALKHIVPSNVTDNAACATITCFFCGRKGHHLRDCSEITDGELEDLQRNINSYNGAEELPYLCIRCYQLDHWAVACPHATSRDRNQSEYGASSGDHLTPNEIQLDKLNSGSTKLLDSSSKSVLQAAGSTHSVREINWKMNEGATSTRMTYDANPVKNYIASSSGENKLKNSQSTLFCKFVCRQISEAPKGIFEFIKKLRLSRTDILKWHMSLEHLNGFYLRLRLGKWEEGLGGTGYYVACITGARIESSSKNSKHLISVNVAGIKCTVENQYISNHDFLEDELMAWWSATTKSGSKIPSEEDLKLKMNERKMLGL